MGLIARNPPLIEKNFPWKFTSLSVQSLFITVIASLSFGIGWLQSTPYGTRFIASPPPMPMRSLPFEMWSIVTAAWAMVEGCLLWGSVTPKQTSTLFVRDATAVMVVQSSRCSTGAQSTGWSAIQTESIAFLSANFAAFSASSQEYQGRYIPNFRLRSLCRGKFGLLPVRQCPSQLVKATDRPRC